MGKRQVMFDVDSKGLDTNKVYETLHKGTLKTEKVASVINTVETITPVEVIVTPVDVITSVETVIVPSAIEESLPVEIVDDESPQLLEQVVEQPQKKSKKAKKQMSEQ